MQSIKTIFAAGAIFAAGIALADPAEEAKPVEATAPVELSAEQMDSITAAGNAYGRTIIEVTGGASFGNLVGAAKKSGTAAHSNYAGGAKALVETVCVHVPSAC